MEHQVGIIFCIFIFCLALGVNLSINKKHEKVTGGVVNYDSTMSKFVYKVYMSREEIINSLKIINAKDDLSCTFDFEKNTVLFSDLCQRKEYFYEIQECEGFSILKLSVASLIELKPLHFLVSNNNVYTTNHISIN